MSQQEDHPDIIPFPNEPLRADDTEPTQLGLIAGAGNFPVEFTRAAQASGHSVFCLGINGLASDRLVRECDGYRSLPLARIGKAIKLFKQAGVNRLIMAGKIEKTVLFHPFRWIRLMPDFRTLHMWFRYAKDNKKDDTILLAVIREFERDGFQIDSALSYAPELLVNHGFLTKRKPTTQQWKDVSFGWELARAMGGLDVGQTVCVNDTAVIAVEAIEGTDKCIRRAGELCKRGGFTVVKVAKPQQDFRFDVPTVGVDTIRSMDAAGARVLAIEANKTIFLEPTEVKDLANRLGITIVAVKGEELAMRSAA